MTFYNASQKIYIYDVLQAFVSRKKKIYEGSFVRLIRNTSNIY